MLKSLAKPTRVCFCGREFLSSEEKGADRKLFCSLECKRAKEQQQQQEAQRKREQQQRQYQLQQQQQQQQQQRGQQRHQRNQHQQHQQNSHQHQNNHQRQNQGVQPHQLTTEVSEEESSPELEVVVSAIKSGEDQRTTIMLRNIPPFYTQSAVLEEINSKFDGMFDFFYLPQNKDMRKEGNPGFAFLNFREYMTVVDFVAEFSGRRWNLDRKKAFKTANVTYARKQRRPATRPMGFKTRKGAAKTPATSSSGSTSPTNSDGSGNSGRAVPNHWAQPSAALVAPPDKSSADSNAASVVGEPPQAPVPQPASHLSQQLPPSVIPSVMPAGDESGMGVLGAAEAAMNQKENARLFDANRKRSNSGSSSYEDGSYLDSSANTSVIGSNSRRSSRGGEESLGEDLSPTGSGMNGVDSRPAPIFESVLDQLAESQVSQVPHGFFGALNLPSQPPPPPQQQPQPQQHRHSGPESLGMTTSEIDRNTQSILSRISGMQIGGDLVPGQTHQTQSRFLQQDLQQDLQQPQQHQMLQFQPQDLQQQQHHFQSQPQSRPQSQFFPEPSQPQSSPFFQPLQAQNSTVPAPASASQLVGKDGAKLTSTEGLTLSDILVSHNLGHYAEKMQREEIDLDAFCLIAEDFELESLGISAHDRPAMFALVLHVKAIHAPFLNSYDSLLA